MNDRWKFVLNGTEIKIEPQVEQLQKWIHEKVVEVQSMLDNAETTLILQNFSAEQLITLKNQIQAEIRRRKFKQE